jgi:hypothetical protein
MNVCTNCVNIEAAAAPRPIERTGKLGEQTFHSSSLLVHGLLMSCRLLTNLQCMAFRSHKIILKLCGISPTWVICLDRFENSMKTKGSPLRNSHLQKVSGRKVVWKMQKAVQHRVGLSALGCCSDGVIVTINLRTPLSISMLLRDTSILEAPS